MIHASKISKHSTNFLIFLVISKVFFRQDRTIQDLDSLQLLKNHSFVTDTLIDELQNHRIWVGAAEAASHSSFR